MCSVGKVEAKTQAFWLFSKKKLHLFRQLTTLYSVLNKVAMTLNSRRYAIGFVPCQEFGWGELDLRVWPFRCSRSETLPFSFPDVTTRHGRKIPWNDLRRSCR
ncbi:unnamed protein product, partial [Ectocarpus sp. 4 AP-2014]